MTEMMLDPKQSKAQADKRRLFVTILPVLVILVATLLVFSNTFGLDWTFDDIVVIVDNPDIRSLGDFFANHYPGRPLRELSYILDYAIFGLKPAGWHLQQLLWHGLNGALLFFLARRLGVRLELALAAALLFLVHPLQVETVASLGHRKEMLLLAFTLMALLLWLRQADGGANPWLYRGGALVCVLLAWTAKQTAVLIPALLLVTELTLLPRERRWLTRGKWPFGLALGAVLAAVWLWRSLVVADGGVYGLAFGALNKMNIHIVTLPVYLLMLLKSWSFMALRVIWPFDLAVEYLIPFPSGWLDFWVVAALLLVCCYSLLLIWSWFQMKPLCFALCCGLFLWLPVANLVPGAYLAADRYFYAPSIGLFIAVALAAEAFPWRRFTCLLLLLLVLPLAWLTWQQNAVWKNSLTLFSQAVKVSPTSTMALTGLGEAYLLQKEPDLALPFLTRAAFNWNQPLAYYQLARIYDSKGDKIQAARWYCMFVGSGGDVPRKNIDKSKVAEYVAKKYGQRCR